jgi:hypothetical protein
MERTLTIFDTSAIQSFIFASNRLRHNVAASYLVEQVTGAWLRKALKSVCGDAVQFEADPARANRRIENPDHQLMAELVYGGGGNAVLLFDTLPRAKAVTQHLTGQVLCEAPGLRLAVAHTAFNWDTDSLKEVYNATQQKLASAKSRAVPPIPMLGQSVSANCNYTDMPAVRAEIDSVTQNKRYFSAETNTKETNHSVAKAHLKKQFQSQLHDVVLETDFGEFGESNEHGYMAVIHADGNGMGQRKKELIDNLKLASENRELVGKLREFSHQINTAGLSAFREVVSEAVQRHGSSAQDKSLPFAPVVYGGDDVTFVCDGYQGLHLGHRFLTAFAAACNQHALLRGAQACAGVAIVNTHYPFARAYLMAADLCQNAKLRAREQDGAYIDWHFAINGAVRSLAQIRNREFTVADGNLMLRPLAINPPKPELRSWAMFEQILAAFKKDPWRDKRNKLKALRNVLRQGPDATKQFRNQFGLDALPKTLDDNYDSLNTGWFDDWCVYFDAIEAMDHVDL